MKTFTFFVLFLLTGFVRGQDFVHIDENEFEHEFGKHSQNKSEEQRDANALEKSEKQINDQNAKYLKGEASYFEELTINSDLPKDVLESTREGAVLPNQNQRGLGVILPAEDEWYTHPDLEAFYETMDRDVLPDSFDGTALGLVTPVKNQGSCGSCANFAATSVHETTMIKAGANLNGLDLSEQQLLDCAYRAGSIYGCNGADSGDYGLYFTSKMGGQSVHEYSYLYVGKANNYTCKTDLPKFDSGAYVNQTMADYYCTEEKLKALVATYGSAVSYLYASDSGFSNYAGGIFNGCTSKTINHAIVVTGYGTDPVNGDYWIIKNSWATSWGEKGYMKLQRGTGMCGIGAFCYAGQGVATGTATPAPALPTADDCDFNSRYGPLDGYWNFHIRSPMITVLCNKGRCKPAYESYTNACMSICNSLFCGRL